MDFEFNEEQKMWHRTMHDFVDKEFGREYYRKCDMERHYPHEMYNKMIERGWWGILMPEKYGGQELDAIMFCITMEALGKYGFDLASGYGVSNFTPLILASHGSEEQKQKFIPPFVRGETKFSISITEPNAGSDAASLACRAVDKGDHWLINGQKIFSTSAHHKGNTIALLARTDPTVKKHKGISVFLMPNDTPGVEMRLLPTIARKATGTNEIALNDVKLPKNAIIGEVNKGWEYLVEDLDFEHVAISAGFVGNAQTAVDDAVRYAKERVQFGQPIAKFQGIAFMLADMQTDVDAARLIIYRAADLLAKHLPCAKESAMSKIYGAEAFQRVTTQGMQILGGYSLLPESDMERYWREAKASCIVGGTVQVMRLIVSRQMGL